MLNDLKWYLIKNQLAKANACKVEKEDIEAFARKMAKIQFAQYGMLNVPEDILANYAQDTLKKEEETIKNMVEKVLEEKVLEVKKRALNSTKKRFHTKTSTKCLNNSTESIFTKSTNSAHEFVLF